MNEPDEPGSAPDRSQPQGRDVSPLEWTAALGDDDLATSLIGDALDMVQPVPAWLTAGADLAWRSRAIDAELLELLSDESATSGARATGVLRAVTFRSSAWLLELSIESEDDGVVIDGLVSAGVAGTSLAVSAELSGGSSGGSSGGPGAGSRVEVPTDQSGRFLLELRWASRVRLHLGSGDSAAVTPWVLLP